MHNKFVISSLFPKTKTEPMSHHIADLISSLATVYKDKPAMISGDRQILYSELPKASRQFAAVLAKLGLQPHDRIGIAMRDGIDFMQAIFTIWTLGQSRSPWISAQRRPSANITEEFELTTILEDRHLIGAIYSGMHWHNDVVRRPQNRNGRSISAATRLQLR